MDPALVWEEIRSIVKGACANLGKSMLEEAEYLELGRKRAPLFVDERPEIPGKPAAVPAISATVVLIRISCREQVIALFLRTWSKTFGGEQ